MEIFNLALEQMLMMFFLIGIGFFLRKKSLIPKNSDVSLARLETYLFVPALALYNQMIKCTVESFIKNWVLILYGAVIVVVAILIAYPLSKLFVRNSKTSSELSYKRNLYKYALTFGNYGFMGNFIILSIWGDDVFYKYSLFSLGVSVACYAWGYYTLIPKEHNVGFWKNFKKGMSTPGIYALILGMLLGITGFSKYIPGFLVTALKNAGNCQGPVAMILAGIVIGGFNFKELLLDKKVYIVSLFRLILLPALMMLALMSIGTNKEIMTLALICFATPLGLNTIVFPAAYGGETKTGASMTMISHTLSVITIPLMYLIFIVYM